MAAMKKESTIHHRRLTVLLVYHKDQGFKGFAMSHIPKSLRLLRFA